MKKRFFGASLNENTAHFFFYNPVVFLTFFLFLAHSILAFGSLDFPICVDYVKTAPFGQKCEPERGPGS